MRRLVDETLLQGAEAVAREAVTDRDAVRTVLADDAAPQGVVGIDREDLGSRRAERREGLPDQAPRTRANALVNGWWYIRSLRVS